MTIEKIACTCAKYPNQFEGIVDGKPFYFRARHDAWYLAVNENASGDGDGLDGRVVAEGYADDEPGGGWEPEDAEVFVRKQLDAYSAGRCPHCEGTGRAKTGVPSDIPRHEAGK
jgi:hypothetical protein